MEKVLLHPQKLLLSQGEGDCLNSKHFQRSYNPTFIPFCSVGKKTNKAIFEARLDYFTKLIAKSRCIC
jgi:hypothetical protein